MAHVGDKAGPRGGRQLRLFLGHAQVFLHLPPLADIEDDAIDPAHGTDGVVHHGAPLPQPAQAAVGVPQAVFDQVGLAAGDAAVEDIGGVGAVFRRDQARDAQAGGVAQEVGGRMAGDGLHAIADEQHGLVLGRGAAEGDAGNIADQRAQLLLAFAQGGQHGAPFADVRNEQHVQVLVGQARAGHRTLHGHRGAILAHVEDFLAAVEQFALPRAQVVQQAVLFRLAHIADQHADVLADDVRLPPAQDAFGGAVEIDDVAALVDGDDAIDGTRQQRAHPVFALDQVAEQFAVAQHADGGGDEDGQGDRQQAHADGQHGLVRVRVIAWGDDADEAGRMHAHVMHAGNRTAHDAGADQVALRRPQGAAPAAQAEAYPQGQGGQHHCNEQRQEKQHRLVAQRQARAHGVHAHVVHGADAQAHHDAAAQQQRRRDGAPAERGQGHERGRHAGHDRQQGQSRRVIDAGAQVEGQHADEMHGPHAAAQRQAAGHQAQQVQLTADAGLRAAVDRHLQCHP
ncbi:hypothetical protein D3C81_557880 [compost metagenome]